MSAPYFFFHPMLAADQAWSALRWQAAGAHPATVEALAGCFDEAGAAPLADRLPLVLAIDPAWLAQGEFIQKFAPNQAIFVLPPSVLAQPAVLEQCALLRKRGVHLALHLDGSTGVRQVPLAAFDHLHIDGEHARRDLTPLDLIHVGDAGLRRIADRVSSHALFAWLAGKQFELSDGGFLGTPDPAHAVDPDTTRVKMLRLLSLVVQDADTREIEAVFREEPKLAYDLLRLVNSVAVGARTEISSFHQAIAMLGRRQLQRWLQLLIYANQYGHARHPNPLMQLAAARGRQMELICIESGLPRGQPDAGDAAFMTGIFSLLDVLLHLPMSEVLDALPLQDGIRAALENHGGFLGELLGALVAAERGEHDRAATVLARLGIAPGIHARAQTAALYWASRINLE